MLVARRNEGSGIDSSHPAAATSGGSLLSAQQASHSEGPEGATSDSDSVFVDGAESSTTADLDWQPNDIALGETDMGPLGS